MPDAAPFVIRHRGQRDGAKRHREVDFHHAPVDDDEDTDGQDAHREAHDHTLKIQPDELAELHRLELCSEPADHRGDVDVGSRRDHACGAVHHALRYVEDAHDDVERVGDDHDGDERLEDPAKEHPGVHVVQVVFVDDHVDQLVAHDEREHHARDGDDDRLGERADHGEDAAIPSGRRRSHLRGNLPDLEVDGVKHAGELVGDSLDEQRFEPLGDFLDDGVHTASSVSAEEAGEERHQYHPDQRDAAARHELLDALTFRAGIVVAVAFEQVDRAPYGKACADGGDEGLQYVDCAVEEFHCVDLLDFMYLYGNTAHKAVLGKGSDSIKASKRNCVIMLFI